MGWTATEERFAHDRGVKGGRTSYNSNVGCCYQLQRKCYISLDMLIK